MTTGELENWLRHTDEQLVKLSRGEIKEFTPYHERTLPKESAKPLSEAEKDLLKSLQERNTATEPRNEVVSQLREGTKQ